MVVWTTIPNSNLEPGAPARSVDALALRDNPIAIANGDAGAPHVQTAGIQNSAVTNAKLDNGSVSQAKIQSSAVGQAELKTTRSTNSGNAPVTLAVPGGQYAFWPEYEADPAAGDITFRVAQNFTNELRWTDAVSAAVRARYIQSSPPYDLGDGEVYGFVYARMAPDGSVNGMFISQDPAWYGTTWGGTPEHFKRDGKLMGRWRRKQVTVDDVVNGRASLEALRNDEPLVEELEICSETKLRGMDEKPHPFIDMKGDETAVLLDPMCETTSWIIERMLNGDSPHKLFKAGYLRVSNSGLKRACPPGLTAHKAKWG